MSDAVPLRQKAVVVTEAGKVTVVEVDVPVPGPEQVLVKVVAAALNHCDWKTVATVKAAGAILGSDFSGTVVKIGSEVPEGQRYIGERVAGFVHGGISPNGAFSEYVVADAYTIVPLPSSLSFETGAQLGICPFGAAQALYTTHELPITSPKCHEKQSLLVFAGATCAGQFVIQLAKMGGLRVIACGSPKSFDLMRKLGADEVYDYSAPYMCISVKQATKGELKYAVDCLGERHSPKQVAWSLGDSGGIVASIQSYRSPRPGVEVKPSTPFALLPGNFEFPMPHKSNKADIERGRLYAAKWSEILASGKIHLPPIEVLPQGLASVEMGLELLMEGKALDTKLVIRVADTPDLSPLD
ncbi:dehydrogenase [Dentipellis sp. KUC8613]|nr:dehydrogenase [Dentipellis sp. KUC8613]